MKNMKLVLVLMTCKLCMFPSFCQVPDTIFGALTGWILGYYGLNVNVGIRLMFSISPVIATGIAALSMFFNPLKETVMIQIECDLENRYKFIKK